MRRSKKSNDEAVDALQGLRLVVEEWRDERRERLAKRFRAAARSARNHRTTAALDVADASVSAGQVSALTEVLDQIDADLAELGATP